MRLRRPRRSRRRRRATGRGPRQAPGPLPPARPLRDRVGAAGEAAARAHLEAQGMRILAHDWRCSLGQIDLVAEDGETIVIVEVKARRGTTFGLPQEAVDARKQRKLRMLTETYRQQTRRTHRAARIDVVALLLDDHLHPTKCDHIRDAIGGDHLY